MNRGKSFICGGQRVRVSKNLTNLRTHVQTINTICCRVCGQGEGQR